MIQYGLLKEENPLLPLTQPINSYFSMVKFIIPSSQTIFLKCLNNDKLRKKWKKRIVVVLQIIRKLQVQMLCKTDVKVITIQKSTSWWMNKMEWGRWDLILNKLGKKNGCMNISDFSDQLNYYTMWLILLQVKKGGTNEIEKTQVSAHSIKYYKQNSHGAFM